MHMKKIILILLLTGSAHADLIVQPSPSPVPTMTRADTIAQQISDLVKMTFGQAPARLAAMKSLIWNTPGVNPCDVVTSSRIGTNAVQIIKIAQTAPAFLNNISSGVAPSPTPHPGYTITPQGNGSVTCVAPSPSPSPSP